MSIQPLPEFILRRHVENSLTLLDLILITELEDDDFLLCNIGMFNIFVHDLVLCEIIIKRKKRKIIYIRNLLRLKIFLIFFDTLVTLQKIKEQNMKPPRFLLIMSFILPYFTTN